MHAYLVPTLADIAGIFGPPMKMINLLTGATEPVKAVT